MTLLSSLRPRPFALLWSGRRFFALGGSATAVLALAARVHPAIRSLD